jgi:hypothetical protein
LNCSARPEGLFDGGHGEEELVGVILKRHELMVTLIGNKGFLKIDRSYPYSYSNLG